MRRLLAGLTIGALAFGAGAVGAKVATVTNPMSADLNANTFQVYNAAGYGVNGDETNIGANYVGTHEYLFSVNHGVLDDPIVEAMAGTLAPSADTGAATFKPGSIYLRHVDATHGELWFKTGPTAADWACIAGCSTG